MKKMTGICIAAVVAGSLNAAAFAQDSPGNMIVSLAPGLNLQMGAPVKDDLLAGTEKFAQGASKVTEINLNPSTMSMIAPSGFGGDATKKMKLLVVHDYSYDKPGMYRMEDVDGYVKKLQDGSWSCPVVSREKDKLSYICAKADPDQTNEMVILDATPQKLTFIHMAGALSLSDLTNMSDRANVLSRHVSPRGNQFTPQIFLQQQQHLQEQQEQLQRRPVIVNGKGIVVPTPPMPTTPAVPVAPATPAQ